MSIRFAYCSETHRYLHNIYKEENKSQKKHIKRLHVISYLQLSLVMKSFDEVLRERPSKTSNERFIMLQKDARKKY